MSETTGVRPPLSLEEVAQATLDLSAERTLGDALTLFRETLRRWAAPSALLAAVRDPAAESGWKLLPTLCAGSGPREPTASSSSSWKTCPGTCPGPLSCVPDGRCRA